MESTKMSRRSFLAAMGAAGAPGKLDVLLDPDAGCGAEA